jgi:hypothetical protein
MEHSIEQRLPADLAYAGRARFVSLLGPMVATGGVIWGILQPDRVTLLHPYGQGFWWLLIEPPLLVLAAGVFFALVVARPLLADLEESDAAAR